MSASKFHAARVRTFGPKAAAVNGNGYTQAGGVSSALMVKSDLLAQGGQVGGRSSAIYVIPDRFGRAGAPAYAGYADAGGAQQGQIGNIKVTEVYPGDSGESVRTAARQGLSFIVNNSQIGTEKFVAWDKTRKRHRDGTNEYKRSVWDSVEKDGKYTDDFALQVGILQRFINEQLNNKAVGVTGEFDEATWKAVSENSPLWTVEKKARPVKSGGGGGGSGGSRTAVSGGDVTPPSTPFYQKPWFMPAAIGVGVLGVVGAIILWPSKKAEQ